MATGVTPKTANISAMTAERKVVASWGLLGVIPVQWTGPGLNLDSPKVATETLELAHHGFTDAKPVLDERTRSPCRAPPAAAACRAPSPSGDTSRPQMEKAALTLYDRHAVPGSAGAERGTIPFQFNPKEVTIQKAAKWERKTAKGAKKAGPPEFSGSEPCKLTLEMFFDATGKQDGSVVEAVEKLFSCTVPTEESAGQKKPSPPLVVLHWGADHQLPGVRHLGQREVHAVHRRRPADPGPVHASRIEEMPSEPGRQNPTSGSDAVRRSHTVVEGDSLASVAYAEYGDPTAWRDVARFNGIDDPLRCLPGTRLLLPSPEEL